MNVDKAYQTILARVVKTLGSSLTYSTSLDTYGKQTFGIKFNGVYGADKIPNLTKLKPYAIINLDMSYQKGSHWVAIAKSGSKIIFYDSFGRPSKSILPLLTEQGRGKIIDTEDDAEQGIIETNCGARAITFLIMFDKYGEDVALKI